MKGIVQATQMSPVPLMPTDQYMSDTTFAYLRYANPLRLAYLTTTYCANVEMPQARQTPAGKRASRCISPCHAELIRAACCNSFDHAQPN